MPGRPATEDVGDELKVETQYGCWSGLQIVENRLSRVIPMNRSLLISHNRVKLKPI